MSEVANGSTGSSGGTDPGTSAHQVASMRRAYPSRTIDRADLAGDWLTQFDRWFTEASGSGQIAEPNAMILATASPEGVPSARTVLLKGYDERGLTFFTNFLSRKGRELRANPNASLVFSWPVLSRQIVVCGPVEQVNREETVEYFQSRPRGSQIGAWASPQSQVIDSRMPLDLERDRLTKAYPEGEAVPVPEHWGGFRVMPVTVEFWQGRPDRLHDRLRYRTTDDGDWVIERLAP